MTCAPSKKEKPQFVVFFRFRPEREGERSRHVPPSPARPDPSFGRPPLRRGTAPVRRPPGGAVGGAMFLDAWRKVVAPIIYPPKTPLGFVKPRPPTPSSIPSKLTVNFVLPYRSEISSKEVDMVIVPATAGQLDMLPPLQRLKPGVLSVHEGNEVTKYLVSSGFAFIHANSVADIVAVEAVPVLTILIQAWSRRDLLITPRS
ncbi:ATP synthase [Musa troglodytarum]|uniref:ATP synthase n=1 Tax=Musa troglodytarum TaxID=320322 RepID=A0A9E7FDN9_9LILI|nr:ATP synthase [Musa troglodytarum]URD94721.1 ATP synthase [Musa troglodytarum]